MPVFCWNLILLLEGNIFPAFLKHSCSWKSCWFDKICWCVISSGSDKYEIRDINEVREGFKTDIFNKIKSNTRLANKWEDALLKSHQNFFSRLSEVTKDVAFSIVFNDDCNQPPVDLVSHPSIKSKSKSPSPSPKKPDLLPPQVAHDKKTRDAWVAAITHCIVLMKSLSGKTEYDL